MDVTLGYSRNELSIKNTDNSRKGYTNKTISNERGLVELDIPRDRKV